MSRTIAALLLLCAAAHAQGQPGTNLQARLVGHQYFLRGFPRENSYTVDAQGNAKGKHTGGPWTLARIDIQEVDVGSKDFRIVGARMAAVFKEREWRYLAIPNETIEIKVDADARRLSDADLDALSGQLFIPDLDGLKMLVPDIWKPYLSGNLLSREVRDPNIQSAKPITAPNPRYNREARLLGWQGEGEVRAKVDENGRVTDAFVETPMGAGLDELAISAVRTWKFVPARNKTTGQAVATSLDITIGFNLL